MTVAPAGPDERGTGFRFDLNLCTGCSACELACSIENELGWGQSWRQVISFNDQRLPSIPSYHLSLACNHCAQAPCAKACPAKAIRRNSTTGAVLIDADSCIGCGYCAWACPYEAPRFDYDAQVMGKCTWCDHRLSDGREPACTEMCPTGALTFGALEGEACVPGFPDTPADPAIRFEPLAQDRRQGPESSWELPAHLVDSFAAARPRQEAEISVRTEWPLLVFSLLTCALVGWLLSSLGRTERPSPWLFFSLAVLSGVASSLHLGRKLRAWRAVLNIRHSWLSREIAAFSAFVAVGGLSSLGLGPPVLGAVALPLGLLTLLSIDRVYDAVRTARASPVHSADALLTGLLVGSLLSDQLLLVLSTLAVKLALYAGRHLRRPGQGARALSRIRLGLRIALGFVLPPLLWSLGSDGSSLVALTSIAVAEILDRVEFYSELEILTPRGQAARDLLRLREAA